MEQNTSLNTNVSTQSEPMRLQPDSGAFHELSREHTLEEHVVSLLGEQGLTVATAESCTGGLLAGRLVNVAGVSEIFHEGYITYSNDAKEKLLHVSHETLQAYGAVSEQTAQEMAVGAARAAGCGAAVATTGIAGPMGGTPQKPVGLVYIGCYVKGITVVEGHLFSGERAQVRNLAVEAALSLLERVLAGTADAPDAENGGQA